MQKNALARENEQVEHLKNTQNQEKKDLFEKHLPECMIKEAFNELM